LADCHEQLDLLAAWKDLKAAEDLAARSHDERLAIARRRVEQVESKLPTFRLVVPTLVAETRGLKVRLDDALIGPDIYGDGVVATTPGTHALEVSAPEKETWHARVSVSPPERDATIPTLTVSLLPAPLAAPPPAEPPAQNPAPPPASTPAVPPSSANDERGGAQRTTALVLGGVGVAGLALGVVTGAIAIVRAADIKHKCGGDVGSCETSAFPTENDAASTTRTIANVSTVSFVAGGAVLAGAALLWFTAPRRSDGRVGVAPMLGPTVGGLSASGRW
jgi:hypothetical protein